MNKNFDDLHRYDDIIDLPHHVSKVHKQMPILDRAAQFAPFLALTGFEGVIRETARLTKEKPLLDEDQKNILDIKLNYILGHLKQMPEIKITYFIEDHQKEGGSLEVITGKITKINFYENIIVIENKIKITIEDIIDIESDIFDKLEF